MCTLDPDGIKKKSNKYNALEKWRRGGGHQCLADYYNFIKIP